MKGTSYHTVCSKVHEDRCISEIKTRGRKSRDHRREDAFSREGNGGGWEGGNLLFTIVWANCIEPRGNFIHLLVVTLRGERKISLMSCQGEGGGRWRPREDKRQDPSKKRKSRSGGPLQVRLFRWRQEQD